MPGGSVAGGHILPTGEDILANGIILKGKYEIQRLIHSGGMGYIYAAMDIRLRRQVVIKQVREQVKSGQHKERLEQEALSMARLSHPSVAMVLDHFTENDYYFLVIEFVPGKTLSEIFEERSQQLTEAEVIGWMLPICEAVDYIHSQGFVHRDISPDNIMLTPEGRIKLIDFGTLYELSSIAERKAGKEGKFGFTPPEQWKGQPVPQSDDFSIGATIYYLLTGFLPVSEECRSGGKPQPSDYSPEFLPIKNWNPDISSDLEAILVKALQPSTSERYSSVEKFRQALLSLVKADYAEKPSELKPATQAPTENTSPQVRKVLAKPTLFWSGFTLLCVGLLGWLFVMLLTLIAVNSKSSAAETTAWIIPFLTSMLLPLIIPGLILLRRSSLLKHDKAAAHGYIQKWWWAIPAAFGLIGGLISWVKKKDIDRRKAMNMLTLGIIISLIWPSMITSVNLVFNKFLASSAPVIFEDHFSDPNSGWITLSNQNEESCYKQGNFSIKVKKDECASASYNTKLLDLDDFVVEADVNWLDAQSSTNGYYSMGFRRTDKDNTYKFVVSTVDSGYLIEKWVNAQNTVLKGWTQSPDINKGIGINRMKVACQGSNLKFYINDVLLTTMTDYSLNKGTISLGVGRNKGTYSDVEALFDNFKVSVP